MSISAIYKIQSIIKPERIYIGSAVDFCNRQAVHIYKLRNDKHSSAKLQRLYKKYGDHDLVYSIIEKCDASLLLVREQYYMDTLKPYFNIRKIAENNMGHRWSDKSRLKMSLSRKGKTTSKKGQKHSIETRNKMSIAHVGKHFNHSEETKSKISLAHKGKASVLHHSEETKKKMSNSAKLRKKTNLN